MPKLQSFQVIRFREPSPFEFYLPQGAGPFPLVCLTPILGRLAFLNDLFLERRFARFYAAHGLATALIDRPIFEFNPGRGLEQIQEYLNESVSRNRRVLDFLIAGQSVDREKIVTYGASFGAVVNILWAAQDPRPKAHLFALGGVNLAEIVLTSRDPLMKSYLKAIVKNTGLGPEELKVSLRKTFQPDLLEAARSIPKEKVCLHLAIFDRVIRFRYGLALREALGRPETWFIPLGHYSAILSIPFLKWQALAFFRKRLGL